MLLFLNFGPDHQISQTTSVTKCLLAIWRLLSAQLYLSC